MAKSKSARPFSAAQFTATAYDTADDKAKFANHAVRFATAGFPDTLFPRWFYTRLSMTFGHIAYFSQSGFYGTWFSSPAKRLDWLRYVARGGAYGYPGDPAFTYCDVERVLKVWVIQSGLIEEYQAQIATATEAAERALLARLKGKYEPVVA